jgi:hypothetical protein
MSEQMKPDELRQIDARIAREVMGWHEWPHGWFAPGDGGISPGLPSYTTSDADALSALDRLCERLTDWEATILSGSAWGSDVHCTIKQKGDKFTSPYFCQKAPTRPLAICLAIVAYLDWKKEQANAR